MEIQKVFSDMYNEERIYSVLMNEDELALFSEIQKEFNSKAAKERNNKYFESLGTDDVRGGKTGRVSYKNAKTGGFDFKLGPSSQEINRENAEIIRSRKINGKFNSSYRKTLKKSDFEEFKRLDEALMGRANKAKVIGVDTKVTSQELAKHRGRDIAKTLDSSNVKRVFEKNKNKLPGKKESIIDPLTIPLKERMTAEKKEIIRGKLKEKAEKAAQSQASIAKHAAQAKHLKNIRNIKRGAGVAAATIGTAGLAYGGKKIYDHYKKKE